MERHITTDTDTMHELHLFKRISWTAIFVGAFVGVGLGFLLNVFGMAIGLSAFAFSNEGAMTLAIGGFIGLIIGVIATMLAAGYTAGYLGRYYVPRRNLGIIYGFCTWSVALILSAVLASHVSNYVVVYTAGVSTGVVADNTQAVSSMLTNQGNTQTQGNAGNVAQNTLSAENFAWGAFIAFILFFIGAVSTCFGAAWGMSSNRED